MCVVACIHVACMRGLNSLLIEEEVFNAIVTMVYAVFVMGEVDKQFSAWLGGNEISQGFLSRDSDGEQFKTY